MRFLVFLCLLLFPTSAFATTLEHGPSPAVAPEQNVPLLEVARVRIHNARGGLIEASRDGGQNWEALGFIETPTQKVNPKGFNASRYGAPGSVVATAVNAIHLKVRTDPTTGRGVIWTLSPRANSEAGRVSLQAEVSPGSFAQTSIVGGSGIFGGAFTPYVGNRVLLDTDRDNRANPLPENYVPRIGDRWMIFIERPARLPREIVFENRFGGLITLRYRDEEPRVVGQVLRPVVGIGRFVGSFYADVGRLRANHNGVIDISTSPIGKIGSFQIVPANHAQSPETHYVRELTQWMVIGPVSALEPSLEGVAPFFLGFLRPFQKQPGDVFLPLQTLQDTEQLLGDYRITVRRNAKPDYEPMPTLFLESLTAPLPPRAGTALADVTHIRIEFPFVYNQPVLTVAPTVTPTATPMP